MLYQSTYFKDRFPEDNKYFETVLVDDVAENLADSLGLLRTTMLSRPIAAAAFIGGMEGIFQEHVIFRVLLGSAANALAVGEPGGAARQRSEEHTTELQSLMHSTSAVLHP